MQKSTSIKIIMPTGPEMIRMYHRNLVAQARDLKEARVETPSLLVKARLVVKEEREIVIRERK